MMTRPRALRLIAGIDADIAWLKHVRATGDTTDSALIYISNGIRDLTAQRHDLCRILDGHNSRIRPRWAKRPQ